WYGLGIALVAGVLSLALLPAIGPVLAHSDYSPTVQREMTEYMQIRLLSVGAAVGIEALGNWYGGLGNPWVQMVSGVITMVVAVFCNWLLIDGHLGAPALGVNGAAVASTIATWLGFAFLALALWRGWGGVPSRLGPLGLTRRELGRVVRF